MNQWSSASTMEALLYELVQLASVTARRQRRRTRVVFLGFLIVAVAIVFGALLISTGTLAPAVFVSATVPTTTAPSTPSASAPSTSTPSTGPTSTPTPVAKSHASATGGGTILWISALICAVIVALLIAIGDRAAVARAAEAATVVLPIALCGEALAYVFNSGWALHFGLPLWAVPSSGSLPTVVTEGVLTLLVLTAVAQIARPAQSEEENRTWDPEKFHFPIPKSRRRRALGALLALAVLSWLSGFLIPRSAVLSWSYVGKGCVVVAVFGDTIVAADVDADHHVASDFTVYHEATLPRFWQSGELRSSVMSDSEKNHKPLFECPASPDDQKSSNDTSKSPKKPKARVGHPTSSPSKRAPRAAPV